MPKIKNKKQLIIFIILLMISLVLTFVEMSGIVDGVFYGLEQTIGENIDITSESPEGLFVHYIDVGQGDCSLLVCDGKTMLIDAGENGHEEDVINYLRSQNIKKLDYIIASHQHSDHIGGLAEVIEEFGCDILIMPRLTKAQTPSNSTYTDFLNAIKKSEIKTIASNPDDVYNLGSSVVEIFGPVTNDAEDINNMSIVMKVTYGTTSFLFTGDAEKEEELEILDTDVDLDCNVLKAGHHGSKTSSSKEFLEKVTPEICIIQVGENNDYGHPHSAALKRIKKYTERIYRNDICGDIVAFSDGENISVEYENM